MASFRATATTAHIVLDRFAMRSAQALSAQYRFTRRIKLAAASHSAPATHTGQTGSDRRGGWTRAIRARPHVSFRPVR